MVTHAASNVTPSGRLPLGQLLPGCGDGRFHSIPETDWVKGTRVFQKCAKWHCYAHGVTCKLLRMDRYGLKHVQLTPMHQ